MKWKKYPAKIYLGDKFCENVFITDHNQKMVSFQASNRVVPSKAKLLNFDFSNVFRVVRLNIIYFYLTYVFRSIDQINYLPALVACPPTIRVPSEFENPHPSSGVSSRPLIFDNGNERNDNDIGSMPRVDKFFSDSSVKRFKFTSSPK